MFLEERPKVLVVDDEPVIQRTVEAVLGDEMDVSSVESTEAAIALGVGQKFDLYVVDKNLGGRDGVELIRQ